MLNSQRSIESSIISPILTIGQTLMYFTFLCLQAEKVPKPTEKVPKSTDKVTKLTEKVSKLTEKASMRRKTNRRVSFDDVEIDKMSKPQKSNNEKIIPSYDNHSMISDTSDSHSIFDNCNGRPFYDEVVGERESRSWKNSSFMIFDDEYRYWEENSLPSLEPGTFVQSWNETSTVNVTQLSSLKEDWTCVSSCFVQVMVILGSHYAWSMLL